MRTGRTIAELAAELTRQAETKRDFVVATDALSLKIDSPAEAPRVAFGGEAFAARPLFHQQLGSHLSIPKPYYDRMMSDAPELLATNVNEWLGREHGQRRMVRTLDGSARAFLSDRFRMLDNYDLAEAILPVLSRVGAQVLSCEVTETRMYIKAIDAKIARDIPTGKAMGDGGHTIFDTCCAAITFRNSEVGQGSCEIATSVFTRACTNMATFGDRSIRHNHVGGRHELGEEVWAMLSDETKNLDNAALWAKVRDLAGAAFDEAKFKALTDQMAAAAGDRIEADPVKVVEMAQRRFDLTDGERGSVLQHLVMGGDLTRYGLFNAITRSAEDARDYDRASDLERVGGQLIELPRSGWEEILNAAATAAAQPEATAPAGRRQRRKALAEA